MYLALKDPLIVLLEQDGARQPDDCFLVGEDADDFGPTLHLATNALYRLLLCSSGGNSLGPPLTEICWFGMTLLSPMSETTGLPVMVRRHYPRRH
jgi:hypothetical protein